MGLPDQQPPQLLELAGKIADGAPVDWEAEAASLDPELLARLRDVEALAGLRCFDESPSESKALETGSRFDRLQILERIGSGAGGVVYRARDPVIGREVALKVCAASPDRRDALLREARQMARIDHPNVLRVHGAVEIDGVVGFWSDLVRGESLDAWVRSRPPPSASEVAIVGQELCAALAAIHAQGLVHGDIKLGNVIRHDSGRWVLLDFGSSSAMTEAVATSGTPLYLAPELFAGGQPTAASDIHALGVVLFRLATGRFPREAEDLASLLQLHRGGKRMRLLDLRPDLEPAFVAAVETALEPRAADRHHTAGDFAHALDATLPRRAKSVVRQWAALAVSLLALALLTVSLMPPSGLAGSDPRISLQRTSDNLDQPLRDGDAVQPGDGISMRYRNRVPAHVYVINEDANGESYQLFPLPGSALRNPLPANIDIRLPGKVNGLDNDWEVSSHGGQERFFVVVSPHPQPQLVARGLALSGSSEALLASVDRIAMQGDVLRGTAGLRERRAPAAGAVSEFSRWLEQLEREDSEVIVQRWELSNP
jgi:serine/threonine protein kinase